LLIQGPDWLWQEGYNVDAPLPEGTSKQDVPAMLRTLLAERFKLRTHTVTKVAPSYALVLSRAGAKLAPAKHDTPFDNRRDRAGIHWRQNTNLANLAQAISNQLQVQMTDETGMSGTF